MPLYLSIEWNFYLIINKQYFLVKFLISGSASKHPIAAPMESRPFSKPSASEALIVIL